MRTMVGANGKRSGLLAAGAAVVLAALVLKYHEVDKSLSDEDMRFIPMYLHGAAIPAENATYDEELDFIVSVQRSVLQAAPRDSGVPLDRQREPKELLEAGAGLCYDRSRVIEKILRYAGFETRHVFIAFTDSAQAMAALAAAGTASHAVTEVQTRRGWLVVDSNAPWVSIDAARNPVPIERIRVAAADSVAIDWRMAPPSDSYARPFVFVYGLYSRHGRFYPPYDGIPDIHYGEFAQNVWSTDASPGKGALAPVASGSNGSSATRRVAEPMQPQRTETNRYAAMLSGNAGVTGRRHDAAIETH